MSQTFITRIGLLQRLRRWEKQHPEQSREFRTFRAGTANFRTFGQARACANGVEIAHGTLEDVARTAGILKDDEQTIDEACKALLLDLAQAGSPRPDRKTAFDRWLKRHPEFAERCRLLEIAEDKMIEEATS